MKIKKALITAAGFGTRFLPVSKTVKKEMLPILNRPLMDYIVGDCVIAGIEEIIIVIREQDNLIQDYYRDNQLLIQHLTEMNKMDRYQDNFPDYSRVSFHFITQAQQDGYGTAIPVKIAESYLKDEEAFLVLMGDDFIYNPNQQSEVAKMIESFSQDPSAVGLATCLKRPTSELHLYGVAKTHTENNLLYLDELVEKPSDTTGLSNLVNLSKYILTPKIFPILKNQPKNQTGHEFYITDTVNTLAKQGRVLIHVPTGDYLDGGSIASWLKANLRIAWDRPELKNEIQAYLTQLNQRA